MTSQPPADRVERFTISGYGGAPTIGTATIRGFTPAARWRRAVMAAAKWWGLAIVAVFIPVAHLVLVPGFFVYGVVQLVSGVSIADLVLEARGTCPDCGEEQALELVARWHLPQAVTCRACQRGLTVAAAS